MVGLRIEPAAAPRRTATTRPSVQRHRWLAIWVAAHFPVNTLIITDVEHARVVRLKGRKPIRHDPVG